MKTIAIIEDNDDNRFLLKLLLEERYEINQYRDGREALEGLIEQPPDLALIDISSPSINGTELLAQLRSESSKSEVSQIPCIALTAHALRGDRRRFLDLGFDAYLAKPIVDETELVDTIEGLLANGRP